MSRITIGPVHFFDPGHRAALILLLNAYAQDPLEVLTGNQRAWRSYEQFGFEPYTLDPPAGQASFMQKWL